MNTKAPAERQYTIKLDMKQWKAIADAWRDYRRTVPTGRQDSRFKDPVTAVLQAAHASLTSDDPGVIEHGYGDVCITAQFCAAVSAMGTSPECRMAGRSICIQIAEQ